MTVRMSTTQLLLAAVAAVLVGVMGVVVTYAYGPLAVVGLTVGLGFLVAALADFRLGLVGLLLSTVVGEPEGLSVGFFTLSPLKLALALVLVGAAVRYLIAHPIPWERVRMERISLLDVSVICLAVAMVLAIAPARSMPDAVKEASIAVLLIALFLVARHSLRTLSDVRFVLWGVAVTGAMIGAYALFQYARLGNAWLTRGSSGLPGVRVAGTFGQPNQLAGLLCMVVPVAITLALSSRGWRRPAGVVLAAVPLAALLPTYSRTGWIAVALGLLVLVVLLPRRMGVVAALPGGVVALMLLATGAYATFFDRVKSVGDLGQAEVASRFDYWIAAARIGAKSPVLGAGLAGFPRAYEDLNIVGKWFLPGPLRVAPPHAHNLPLTFFAEAGLVGLGAVVFVGCATLATIWRALRPGRKVKGYLVTVGLVSGLVAFGVSNMTDVTFFENVTATTMWVELACLAALADLRSEWGNRPEAGEADPMSTPTAGS